MEAAIVTTYRCSNRCYMCHTWKHPTSPEEEFKAGILARLPPLAFCNITGGEPFLRDDLEEIIAVLKSKARRIVVSTNGFFTDKTIRIARENPEIGIRISLEGLPAANDELRGVKDGFDHGLRTLLELQRLGLEDIGFGITVSDRNAQDMLELYQLAKAMGVEFATAVVHNSYYFHKDDNEIREKDAVIKCFETLVDQLLRTNRIKNWFRAYFNYGLINYIRGRKRLLPCGAGRQVFFLDPWGEVRPCNGQDVASAENSMGNLNQQSFAEIWNGEKARGLRKKLRHCPKNCWMIGTASPAMKKYIFQPARWVVRNKIRSVRGKSFE